MRYFPCGHRGQEPPGRHGEPQGQLLLHQGRRDLCGGHAYLSLRARKHLQPGSPASAQAADAQAGDHEAVWLCEAGRLQPHPPVPVFQGQPGQAGAGPVQGQKAPRQAG